MWFLGSTRLSIPRGRAKKGKGWNVTSAGWQVTLCDPICLVSSGVATSVSELLYPCYFTLGESEISHQQL